MARDCLGVAAPDIGELALRDTGFDEAPGQPRQAIEDRRNCYGKPRTPFNEFGDNHGTVAYLVDEEPL